MAIHIGCSGWHYLHWRGNFYPEGTKTNNFLGIYKNHFDTVEINNSFYRLPSENALLAWRNSVPAHFKFSVKASRFITHNKKLKDSSDSFITFFNRIILLGDHLGPILFQLPPRWNYNHDRLEEFLVGLPADNNYVFEFRNYDWMREEAFALLRKYHAGFCIHDMTGSVTPEVVTSNTIYIRFHGSGEKYGGSYSDKVLEEWAVKLIKWSSSGKKIFVYFNNDINGAAPKNALTLKGMIQFGKQR